MKNTPADFEHAAELLAENARLRAALAERVRKHEAALADFEHAAELLAENTRLRAALAERARQHEAALADIEKAQTDIGRLRIWHERALEQRDATRAERDEAVALLDDEEEWLRIIRADLDGGAFDREGYANEFRLRHTKLAALRARLSALGKPASEPIDAEEVRLMREVCRLADELTVWDWRHLVAPREHGELLIEDGDLLEKAVDALRRHRERHTRRERG